MSRNPSNRVGYSRCIICLPAVHRTDETPSAQFGSVALIAFDVRAPFKARQISTRLHCRTHHTSAFALPCPSRTDPRCHISIDHCVSLSRSSYLFAVGQAALSTRCAFADCSETESEDHLLYPAFRAWVAFFSAAFRALNLLSRRCCTFVELRFCDASHHVVPTTSLRPVVSELSER